MIKKYIALSALACAAILPLSAQAQSNSADADVNITLVQPIAVSYTDGSGFLGSILLGSDDIEYSATFAERDTATFVFQDSENFTFLEDPTSFDFTVSGGTSQSFSVTFSLADTDASDGVSAAVGAVGCDGPEHFIQYDELTSDTLTNCTIQDGSTIVRIAPSVTVAGGSSPITNGKVATLTTSVAYE